MKIKELVDMYVELIDCMEKVAKELGETLVHILKPIIPDIRYSVGWAEAGADVVCLWSESRDVNKVSCEDVSKGKYVSLRQVIVSVIPELRGHIDCPYGIYITPEEAEKIRKILKEAFK